MVEVQAEARAILEGYLARPETEQKDGLVGAAERLLAEFQRAPERIAALVVGERTPNGRPTFSALVTARDTQGAVARGLASPIAMPSPMDPSTRPAEPLTVIEQGPEGGPEIDSAEYRHHRLRYPRLNAVQALVLPWVDRDVNVVVAAATSAGKTVAMEMLAGEGLSRGGRALVCFPLRAVASEKHQDFTDPDHDWQKQGHAVSIITGDYRLTDARVKELNEASVVIMTTEMLNVRCRMQKTEKSAFLSAASTLILDEAHLLSMEGRGDAMEVGLMLFTKQNPNARIVLLSATMPNVEDLGRWLTRMTGRPTVVIRSAWRPTKLGIEYQGYYDKGSYQVQETTKVRAALGIVQQYKDDRFIVFVHAKKTGQTILESLKRLGVEAEFHSADLDMEDRNTLERRFKSGNLRVIVATSTLSMGLNLPARRVVVVGVHRGMQLVDSMDVIQMVGRAGRYGIDPRGDAHVLLPESKLEAYEKRFSTVEPIRSRLRKLDELAFHLTAEVSDGDVRTPAAAVAWHARSFAALQGESMAEGHEAQEDDAEAPSAWQVVSRLCRVGVLARTPQQEIEATPLGRVAAHLYFSPFDAAWWASAFRRLAEQGLTRNDMALAWAVGEAPSFRRGDYIAKDLKDDHARFADNLSTIGIPDTEPTTKTMALSFHLRGQEPPEALRPVLRGFQRDAGRVSQAISQIDRRVLRVLGTTFCELLGIRLSYGVNWEAADICRLPGIGPKRAEQLLRAGIRSIGDVARSEVRVLSMLGTKIGTPAIAKAKDLSPLPWSTIQPKT